MEYIIKGIAHYAYLIFDVLDFIDSRFRWLIIFIAIYLIVFNKGVRNSTLGIIMPFIKSTTNPIGMVFIAIFASYYVYILLLFEERITIGVVLLSIYMLLRSYTKVAVGTTKITDSRTTLFDMIKDVSLPVILLCVQQIICMIEGDDISNLFFVILSLLAIPLFSLAYICTYQVAKLSNSQTSNMSLVIEKIRVGEIIPQKEKVTHSNVFKFFNIIWVISVCIVAYSVISIRFFKGDYTFAYHCSLVYLVIYLWYDLMKSMSIENQYDFISYGFIFILSILFIIYYSSTLKSFRLSELGFLMPIFIFIHIKNYYKKFPHLPSLPKITKNNIFGVDNPEDYIK